MIAFFDKSIINFCIHNRSLNKIDENVKFRNEKMKRKAYLHLLLDLDSLFSFLAGLAFSTCFTTLLFFFTSSDFFYGIAALVLFIRGEKYPGLLTYLNYGADSLAIAFGILAILIEFGVLSSSNDAPAQVSVEKVPA